MGYEESVDNGQKSVLELRGGLPMKLWVLVWEND